MDMDKSTDDVIDWLFQFKLPFIRINPTDLVEYNEKIKWSLNNQLLNLGRKSLLLNDVTVGWVRKFGYFSYLPTYKSIESTNSYSLKNYLHSEITLFRQIFLQSQKIKWLCHPINMAVSKIKMLVKANDLKISIPQTFIVNNKRDLIDVYRDLGFKAIFKSIGDIRPIKLNGTNYLPLTSRLSHEVIQQLPSFFIPSLIQEEIEKEFEIRTFYLDGKFYSAAIFSQLNDQTSIDFRNYDSETPNRCVPYHLPKRIEEKLHDLMVILKLNTGSIDLIKSKDGKFYFLEINPSGQFGFISSPCNFNIEYEIATYLKKLYNE